MIPSSAEDTQKSSSDNERHGLLGRAVENWLTSINERQYQLPFCQVLASEGETVLYVSAHGPYEKGKDIITRAPNGEIHAYQLKAGDIGLGEWNAIHVQIANLVELAIELPGTPPVLAFSAYLVTNGTLTDPVLEYVRASNVTWAARGLRCQLRIVQRSELVDRFVAAHGSYLPRELKDFRLFLELILRDGAGPADKGRAARLLEDVLPAEPENESRLGIARAAASVVLLAGYFSGPAVRVDNHWCVFEYWVLAGAYVLYLAEKSGKAASECQISFQLCEAGAETALEELAKECKERDTLVEGFRLVDGHVFGARAAILVGALSALDLHQIARRKQRTRNDFVSAFLHSHMREAKLWGESAIPFFYLAALKLERDCRPGIAEGLMIQLVREISNANSGETSERGIPSCYYSAEDALRLQNGIDLLNDEQFVGASYAIASLVDYLARRWRRQALASLWFGLTRINLTAYLPASPSEWLRWYSSEGVQDSHLAGEPESWSGLRARAESLPTEELPQGLRSRPGFAVWFILVYPHRFTPPLAKLIEDGLWAS